MLTPGSDLRAQMDQLFDNNNCIPRIAIETRECNAAPQYVVLNFGMSILPQVPINFYNMYFGAMSLIMMIKLQS